MNDQNPTNLIVVFGVILLGIIAIIVYLLPTIIAFRRGHHYRWIICALNIFIGFTGLGYLAALIWAIWPNSSSNLDSSNNAPSSNGFENTATGYEHMDSNRKTNINEVAAQEESAHEPESSNRKDNIDSINATPHTFKFNGIEQNLIELHKLKESGLISDGEFKKMKNQILGL